MAIRNKKNIATYIGIMLLSFTLGVVMRTAILNVGNDKIVLAKTIEPSIQWDWELCYEE